MSEEFTFDDEISNVLQDSTSTAVGRPKKKEAKKDKCINCYLSHEEYTVFMDFLDGRPASSFIRKHILETIKTKN